MAFDGITMANLTWEFKQTLEGGRIQKIAQPEKDELILTIKGNRKTIRLQISASASLPLIYEASQNKPSSIIRSSPGWRTSRILALPICLRSSMQKPGAVIGLGLF